MLGSMELRLTEMGKTIGRTELLCVEGVGIEIRSLDFYIVVLRCLLVIKEMDLNRQLD